MIAVSSGWVDAHKGALLPEMFLELTYRATEPGLQQDSSASATGGISFSEAETVVDGSHKTSEPYGTFERGFWGLDGGFTYFDGTPIEPGYVSSSIARNNCVFGTPPKITINLASQHTELIPGITIMWSEAYNEWATNFKVTAYNGSVVVAQTEVVGNASPVSVVWMDLSSYNRITIDILQWSLPNHRARCASVFLGIERIYGKEDLLGFEHTQSADLLSAALPKNAITFRLRNDDNRWNPDNPDGVEKYLLEQQEIHLRYGMTVDGKTEWIKGGTFWLSEWSTPSNGMEASFTARDAFEFMGGIYAGPRSGTLYAIAQSALRQAELSVMDDGSERFVLADVLKNYNTDFTAENTEYTIAQILQLVAHAGCCVCHQDREGIVRIEPMSDRYEGFMIEPHISYAHPEYTMGKPLRAVAVSYGDGQTASVVSGSVGEVQSVDNPMLRTQGDALRVGEWTKSVLEHRKVISGEFRADVRLDVLDNIIVTSKYASNVISVTEVSYSSTGGAFRGKYTGRVTSIELKPTDRRSNEYYSGEV